MSQGYSCSLSGSGEGGERQGEWRAVSDQRRGRGAPSERGNGVRRQGGGDETDNGGEWESVYRKGSKVVERARSERKRGAWGR